MPEDDIKPATKPDGAPWHIGCMARLESEKGIDLLIDAIADIDNVMLTIVGKGSQKEVLLKQAKLLNHSKVRVQFIDRLSTFDDLWSSADCFVLPSRTHDPFGLVAAAAMAHGVPTIVTDKCGISGYMEHKKHGIICNNNDLHASILQLQKNPLLQQILKLNGQKLAQEQFSVAGMVGGFKNILNSFE